jgi:outer membrane lipoprotein LolB
VKYAFILLSALLLTACVSPGPQLTPQQRQQAWQQHAIRLANIESWSLSGRVAVRADGKGWQAGMRWKKSGERQEVTLTGPFGGGVILLTENPSGFILRDNRGDEYFDTDAERLLELVTGWRLPVNGLTYWVQGRAAPDAPSTIELDGQGRAQTLAQHGWQISYLKYVEHDGLSLPGRMLLKHEPEGGLGEALEVRLALNDWKTRP